MEKSDLVCRICLDGGAREDFIAPCSCTGSMKWVHRRCLDQWRSSNEDHAFAKCTECHVAYKLICVTNDAFRDRMLRRLKFTLVMTKEIGPYVVVSQAAIVLVGFVVYLCDSHKHKLISAFKMSARPWIFYYLMGLLISLAVLGMFIKCLPQPEEETTVGCNCCRCTFPGRNGFQRAAVGRQDRPVLCGRCCDTCGANGCPIACDAAAGAGGPEACMFFIGVLIIFALLGIFYCVVIGAYYIGKISRKHIHILKKLNLAQEYKVVDLAEDAMQIDYMPPDAYGGDVESGLHSSGASSGGAVELTGRHTYSDEEEGKEDEMPGWTHVNGGVSSSSGGDVSYGRIADSSSHGGQPSVSIIHPNITAVSSIGMEEQRAAETQTLLSAEQRKKLLHLGLL